MRAATNSRTSNAGGTVTNSYQSPFAEKERALNWSLFDLRTYDGRTGRFHSPDPMPCRPVESFCFLSLCNRW